MLTKTKVTVANGDGIGPEIMAAVINILENAGANIEYEFIDIGEKVYKEGFTSGIRPEAWDSIRQNGVFLKAPITTPQGGGYKSLNVTIRKALGLFANVRPSKAMAPFIKTHYPNLDVVIVRENEEDLYAGIEYRQTNDVVQGLKLISYPGSDRIIRYAFEYCRSNGRKKLTCMAKDNIMKITDGLFTSLFKEIGKEFPDIDQDIKIIDIGAALLAERPEVFDVVVTQNLYGDIISDIVAQVSGSVGLGGSANIGPTVSMFEAIHGSAPDIAGRNLANPSGLLNGAIMMLVHIGQHKIAEKIMNAWLKTIEEGIHTGDIFVEGKSKQRVGTQEFASAIIERLGQKPEHFATVEYAEGGKPIVIAEYISKPAVKTLMGVDVFVDWKGKDPDELASKLIQTASGILKLKIITNRGAKVYPGNMEETFCSDHWRCRFVAQDANVDYETLHYRPVSYTSVMALMSILHDRGIDIIKTENLYYFDGERGFTLGQGE